jgi:2',3'-cyclic-nucleotide 2'-phosphodiesterase (5'-nucleotidase family)
MVSDKPQGLLGNWVADLLWNEFKDSVKNTDHCFSLINTRGLRAPLTQGKITVQKIFEIMPFDNEVVIVTYPGEKINELTAAISKAGGHPVSKNIRFHFINNICSNPLINNHPFTHDDYYIITTDYLADGGDNMIFFNHASNLYKTGLLLRDVIIKYIEKQNEPIQSSIDERIIFK